MLTAPLPHPARLHAQVSGDEAAAADAAAPGAKGDSFVGSLEEAVLHNANQFHKWHTELEAACASETEEKYQQYAQLLQNHLASCDRLQDQVGVSVGRSRLAALVANETSTHNPTQQRAAPQSPAFPACLPTCACPSLNVKRPCPSVRPGCTGVQDAGCL